MARYLALSFVLVLFLFSGMGSRINAQPTSSARCMHVEGLVLDDGNGHTYSVFVPSLTQSSTYILPQLPSTNAISGFVNAGSLAGQTLYWDGVSYVPTSDLLNSGTDITASGNIIASNFNGGGSGLTGLNASALSSGTVPLPQLSGITSTQLSPTAGIVDGQIVSLNASKLIGSTGVLDGSQITNINPANISSGTANISISGNATTATIASNLSGNIPEAQVTNLTTDLAAKATDASVVHTTGVETVAGAKTFSTTIAGSINGNAATATTATNLSGNIPESQVTNLVSDLSNIASNATVVHLTGAETIAGTKTFSSTIAGSISGNAATATNATTAANLSGNIPESQVTNLTTDLAARATDANVVHTTGAETIAGTKTFSSTIVGNITGNAVTATTAANATNATTAANLSGNIPESQVTNLTSDLTAKATDASVVHLAGAETISGAKTFSTIITGSISGNAATAITATNATNFASNIPESQVTNLATDLTAKATDANVVHLAGAETISGAKTFSTIITGSISGNAVTATTATNATNATTAANLSGNIPESQVTNLTTDLAARATDANVVHTTGAESVSGTKTFSSAIVGSITGNAATSTIATTATNATTAANLSGNIPESQVTNLTTDLAAKATDASVVHTTGAETVAGAKTFSTTIAGSINGNAATATTATNLSGNIPESQVTNLVSDLSNIASNATVVHLTGAETIAGTKTFSSTIAGSISGNAATATNATNATTASNLSGNITESQVTNLTTDLAARATDANVVHFAGTETISGAKTFSTIITGSISGNAVTATTATNATNFAGNIPESQVTNLATDLTAKATDASVVHLAGTETLSGAKTFSTIITGSISGNAATATTATNATNATTAANLSGNIPESQVTNLSTDLTAKATDASVVHLAGTETIAGAKTFSTTIAGSISGNAASATTSGALSGNIPESQVTNLVSDLSNIASNATVVHLTGAETIAGTKTFSSTIAGSITGNAATATNATTAANLSGNIPESQVTNLTTDLAARATDANVVHTTGAETIAGTKTFSSTIVGNITGNAVTATTAANATNATTAANLSGNIPESQVTNLTSDLAAKATDANVVHLAGAETISGAKTFSTIITGSISGNAATATTATNATNFASNIPESQVTNLATDLTAKAIDANVVHLAGAETISGAKTFSTIITGSISGNAATATTATNATNATTAANLSGNIPESQVTNLSTDLTAKATDASVVHLAGTETVSGAKTFSSAVTVNAQAQVTGFKMATGAATTYVLTSDLNGVGTWQAASGGGGSLSGGTTNYIPLWSSSSALTSSVLYQSGTSIGINKSSSLGATLDVSGTGQYSGTLTANGGITMGGTLYLAGNTITADTGKSVGSKVLTSSNATSGFVDITGANLTATSQIFLTGRHTPSDGYTVTSHVFGLAVTTINTVTHTFRVNFGTNDWVSTDIIYWMIVN